MNVRFTDPTDPGEATDEEAEIHIDRVFDYIGKKTQVVIESPYSAKDDIKDLSYDRTRRSWDPGIAAWTADLAALNHVVRHLLEAGWEVSVDLDVPRRFESYQWGGVFRPDVREQEAA